MACLPNCYAVERRASTVLLPRQLSADRTASEEHDERRKPRPPESPFTATAPAAASAAAAAAVAQRPASAAADARGADGESRHRARRSVEAQAGEDPRAVGDFQERRDRDGGEPAQAGHHL